MNTGNMNWLEDNEYNKAMGQFRLQLGGVFEPFQIYGLQEHIPNAIGEICRLAEDFSLRVRGVDKPISLERVRNNHKKVRA